MCGAINKDSGCWGITGLGSGPFRSLPVWAEPGWGGRGQGLEERCRKNNHLTQTEEVEEKLFLI